MNPVTFPKGLLPSDVIVLRNLSDDIDRHQQQSTGNDAKSTTTQREKRGVDSSWGAESERDASDVAILKGLNDPADKNFEPSIFTTIDARDLPTTLPGFLNHWLLRYYVSWAKKVVRHEVDIIMLTHLIIYFSTSVPSAAFLFYRFSYVHGIIHFAMQQYYMGPYTLMRHQHIHMGGVLAKLPGIKIFDALFPYITDPLMGHTWNSYYYHHVKHHHVEGNGPGDLSSTMSYQRDSALHFLHYLGRFAFFVWLDLPLYFLRRGRRTLALKTAWWEWSNVIVLFTLFYWNTKPTFFVFILPLSLMRLGMMVGNWGQHAFVDADDPTSDFRSSITLIDVPSNRFSFNDGYHTSHHLNPHRHWRDHPVSFLQQKGTYAAEHALVFHKIDYIVLTFSLLTKNYAYLEKCLVPIGAQIDMSTEERIAMLKSHTRQFTEQELKAKYPSY